jgi:hypothetical protein
MLLFLGTILLGSCSRSHQLGMEESPQELLDMTLRDSEAVLTPSQSITLLNHCAELGEQNAALAAEKTVSIFAGNTGVGKSTTLNALLGCQMKVVRSRELGLPGARKMIVVDPESPREEVMPIGHHSRQSQTFLPKIVQTPGEPSSAYCDCPGFSDTRGAEINIANAINIRKILQQATGVKAVFLASYYGLFDERGSSIRNVETMCRKMFGSVDSLKRYQNSVLLGITKAPLCEGGEPLTTDTVRELLTGANSDIATILANRIFLFDPLDRTEDNPHFWSIPRCRTEIARLEHIPQQLAKNLFQTTLTDGDQVHLLTTVRRLRPKMVNAITQGDVTALGQHWQLLQRLRVVEHPEVDQLIEGGVLPTLKNEVLKRIDSFKYYANAHDFALAENQLDFLTTLQDAIPGAPLELDLNALRRNLKGCRQAHKEREAMQKNQEALQQKVSGLTAWMEAERRRSQEALQKIQEAIQKMVNAITQDDITALGQHWQLLQRLRVVEHPEVDQLIEGGVLPTLKNEVLKRIDSFQNYANAYDFALAENQLDFLTTLQDAIPGAPLELDLDLDALRRNLKGCRQAHEEREAMQKNQEALQQKISGLTTEMEAERRQSQE